MLVEAQLAEALQRVLPPQLAFFAPALAQVLVAAHQGDDHTDSQRVPSSPMLSELLATLAGQSIQAGQHVVAFGPESNVGDVTIQDVAGHNLIKLTVNIYDAETIRTDAPLPPRVVSDLPRIAPLPIPLTPIIGRDTEIAHLQVLFRQPTTRVVTLSGPGGVGKTRLALAFAAELSASRTGGVAFISLAPLTDPAQVLPTIATALGLRETPDRSLIDHLYVVLSDQPLLLILDNLEHLLGAVSHLALLLASAPRTQTLATSRAPLGLTGEIEVEVTPLPTGQGANHQSDLVAPPPAVRLFVERAQAVRRGFALSPTNQDAVATICAYLDGLPLAIELAAAWIRVLTPAQILARLTQRLDALKSTARDRPERHQTLRTTITWSYNLLTLIEQHLFARLAVFVGTWAGDAIVAVCGDADDADAALLVLESLVQQSLVRRHEADGGTLRFSMLETVRDFAHEQLVAQGEEAVIRHRHLAYYNDVAGRVAAEAQTGNDSAWEHLEVELDNLRAALTWAQQQEPAGGLRLAVMLQPFWYHRALNREGLRWLELLLQVATEAPTDLVAEAQLAAGMLAYEHDQDVAGRHLTKAVMTFRAQGDRVREAMALFYLGWAAFCRGASAEARVHFTDSLAIQRVLGDQAALSSALNAIAWVAQNQDEAQHLYGESLAISRALGHHGGIIANLHNLGRLALNAGDLRSARPYLEEALQLAHESSGRLELARLLRTCGELEYHGGDDEQAHRLLNESLALMRHVQSDDGTADVLSMLAHLALRSDTGEEAARLARESLTSCYPGDMRRVSRALGALAAAEVMCGRGEQGAKLCGLIQVCREQGAGFHENWAGRLSAVEAAELDRLVAWVRAKVGEEQYGQAAERGRSLLLAQVVRFERA